MAIDSCRTSEAYVNSTEKRKGMKVGGDFRGASFSFFNLEKCLSFTRFHWFEEMPEKCVHRNVAGKGQISSSFT